MENVGVEDPLGDKARICIGPSDLENFHRSATRIRSSSEACDGG
jgi:hypothetical protein